ncbi:MAG: transketolase [Alphaproteobacteria bacterium]|nr:transketolase [Alphaproteobacteria bacterium]
MNLCKCGKQNKDMANAIRFLSADAIEKSNSGHPGMPLGMADVATVLFSQFIKLNPSEPHWFDRDRFVLSAGHGSMLMYSLLYLLGYKDISINDIKNFRQLGAKTAGHPEYGHLAGIDMTTGPLGQGITSAVGMALAERMIAAKYGDDVCNHYTYVIAGDGCLMEGISEEAISVAGHLKLNKLIVFWDNNNITIDGKVDAANSTDQIKRFEACGWNTIEVDGHCQKAIAKAIVKAQKSKKPTLIACKTTIGFGAPSKCGTSKCHGSPLGAEELENMRRALNWTSAPFEIPDDIIQAWRDAGQRNIGAFKDWQARAKSKGKEFNDVINGKLPKGWDKELNQLKETAIAEKTKVATRKASQMCLEAIVPHIPQIIGGSADLAASNLTLTKASKTITAKDYNGNNIMYGIREHAMAAIMNGMALHGGIIPFGGTFFVFSDYMRPAQRLSALMGIRVIYVLTHDSIGVGEDGPTHQPIEHLASYRCMPNILTFRPCDIVETAEAWQIAIETDNKPSILALTRQNLPLLRSSAKENLTSKGGYVLSEAQNKRQATIIATGSEVSMAMEAKAKLAEEGIDVAVVSMPCCELFDAQPIYYQEKVLGTAPRIAVEAASKFGWEKYVGLDGDIIGMDGFGASGPAGELFKYFGITVEEVVDSVKDLIR